MLDSLNTEVLPAAADPPTVTRVYLKEGHAGWYSVTDANGQVLVERSCRPEFDACLALHERGVIGTLETWRVGGAFACMTVDIENGAEWVRAQRAVMRRRNDLRSRGK
jgi:hypothetical protein